jgi:hypothetical protein
MTWFVEAVPHPAVRRRVRRGAGDASQPVAFATRPPWPAGRHRQPAGDRAGAWAAGVVRRSATSCSCVAPGPSPRRSEVSDRALGSSSPPVREVDPSRPAIVVDGVTETFRLYHERPSGLKERSTAAPLELHRLQRARGRVLHGRPRRVGRGHRPQRLRQVDAAEDPRPDPAARRGHGRDQRPVASLLELGAGFHGDLTGRENIYLNGAILGLSRPRSTSASTRSSTSPASGRCSTPRCAPTRRAVRPARVRDRRDRRPDILLVDEVLAVGDAEFQERSLERMRGSATRARPSCSSATTSTRSARCATARSCSTAAGRVRRPVSEGVELYRQRVASAAAPRTSRPDLAAGPHRGRGAARRRRRAGDRGRPVDGR